MATTQESSAYRIIWRFMPDGWAKGISANKPLEAMPFFVDHHRHPSAASDSELQLTHFDMLVGILLTWFSPRWRAIGGNKESKQFLEDVLKYLAAGFSYESQEQMFLDAAAQLRREKSYFLSAPILSAAKDIIPTSSKIKSDLIFDLWLMLECSEGEVEQKTLRALVASYVGLNGDDVDPAAVDPLRYIYIAALKLLGEDEALNRHCEGGAIDHIRDNRLRSKAAQLVDAWEVSLAQVCIWNGSLSCPAFMAQH